MTGRRVFHHLDITFLSVIKDAPLLTKTVKINQSEGIPGSGVPECTFVKNSYKRSHTSLPSPPLLFITFFTSHRSPLSERLEQATNLHTRICHGDVLHLRVLGPICTMENSVCSVKKSVNGKQFLMQAIFFTHQKFLNCHQTSNIPSISFGRLQCFVRWQNLLILDRYP